MGRKKREEVKDQLEGWSKWKKAMVPDAPPNQGPGKRLFNPRPSNRPGYYWANIGKAFKNYDCGIYEWQARGTKKKQPSRVVVYVGSTCRENLEAIKDRSKEYCRDGSHKKKLINKALRNGYELWVRAKPTDTNGEAELEENELLSKFDYAWNKSENGNRTRNILP